MKLSTDAYVDLWKFGVPHHMHPHLIRYVEDHHHVGGFLAALLSNDLRRAVQIADNANILALPAYVRWLWEYAPGSCWGSREAVRAWIDGVNA